MEPRVVIGQTPRDEMRSKVGAAISANQTYLALPTPTQAQVVAQVDRLTRQTVALLRMAAGLADTTESTTRQGEL